MADPERFPVVLSPSKDVQQAASRESRKPTSPGERHRQKGRFSTSLPLSDLFRRRCCVRVLDKSEQLLGIFLSADQQIGKIGVCAIVE